MKISLILLLCMLPAFVLCTTRTVSLDGTQQYTNIQSAVNASVNGDVVLVYPGRYIENIILNNQDITIESLYAQYPQQTYIESTIIDGNLNIGIKIANGENVIVNGFTIVNNEQNIYNYSNRGGGITVYNQSILWLFNTIIRNCTALYAGGINVSEGASLHLSNVRIFDNKADHWGGGILVNEANKLSFDLHHPSSVYNNFAAQGMDILFHFRYENPDPFNIDLSLGSLALSEVDGYFISVHNANVNVNIQQGCVNLIDNNLYVSPDGNDMNNGLSPDSPFRSISYAMQRIASNPNTPRTLYLAPGTYSNSANEQIRPYGIKSHIRVHGAGIDETIIDKEGFACFWNAWHVDDIEISGMKMINGRSINIFPLGVYYSSDIYLHDLKFENNRGLLYSGIVVGYCDNVIVENIIAGYTTYGTSIMTFSGFNCDNMLINNFISANNTLTDWESNRLGFDFSSCDLVLRNSIIANNTAQDAWPFFYTNIYPGFEDFNLDMSNVLIINNNIYDCWWVSNPIYMQNRFQRMQINNCTFANNITDVTLTNILAMADIRNLISYNPGAYAEMHLTNYLSSIGSSYNVSISNSLFSTNTVSSSLPNLITLTDNIMGSDPVFLGTVDTSLSVNQPEYYQLSAFSPCIDSGTPDTEGLNLPPMDLAGNRRIWNGRIDMGCYEYGSDPYVGIDDPALPPPAQAISISVYPNPLFNASKAAGVFIEFTLPQKPASQPLIQIFNIRGQKVKNIQLSESYNSLVHKAGLSGDVKQNGEFFSTVWNGKDDQNRPLASGTYIVKVMADRMVATTKITIIK